MRVYQKHAGDDAKLLIKFHWPKNRSRNFDTGWVLCHIAMVFIPIPFKPQKGGSAKSRNGTNWGARQVEESFETDFASFPTAT